MDFREALQQRTKAYAVRVVGVIESLARTRVNDIIAKQIIRSATSVGADYRSARRARSKAEFISKLQIAQKESDETLYWLELLKEPRLIDQ